MRPRGEREAETGVGEGWIEASREEDELRSGCLGVTGQIRRVLFAMEHGTGSEHRAVPASKPKCIIVGGGGCGDDAPATRDEGAASTNFGLRRVLR